MAEKKRPQGLNCTCLDWFEVQLGLHSGLTCVSACLVLSMILVWLTPIKDCHGANNGCCIILRCILECLDGAMVVHYGGMSVLRMLRLA